MYEGSPTAKIIFVSDYQRPDAKAEGATLSEYHKAFITSAMNRSGIPESDYAFAIMYPLCPKGGDLKNLSIEDRVLGQLACKKFINDSSANVIVPLGEHALNFITGLDNVHKQKCSILQVKAEFGAKKAIPLPHPEHIQKVREDQAYYSLGCQRLREEKESSLISIPNRKFLLSLDLPFEKIISYLEDVVLNAPELSIDVETGRGVVNTHGFAISHTEAIAIDVLPSTYKPIEFYKLWSVIARIMKSDIPKIAQNGLYECQWASLYGIEVKNISFDTMWAMKLLHPSLDKGLDNAGRIYTRFPYWKDDHSDWNNVRNWRDHLTYNGKDTTGQFAAKINMVKDLEQRGLMPLFKSYMGNLFPQAQRMTNRGLVVDEQRLSVLKADLERSLKSRYESLDKDTEHILGRKINPNSPKQVKDALKEIKIRIPTSKGKETIAKDALVKLRKTYPKSPFLVDLIEINKLSNQLETYFNFKYDKDKRIRFSLDAVHNEFGEWNSSKNPFDSGFSIDEVPKLTRNILVADEGYELLQLNLHWPEMRYLAYDSGDQKMIKMIQEFKNIPVHIASQIFRKFDSFIHEKSLEARVAEKTIQACAYAMSPRAFATKCMGELGFGMTEIEARRYIQIVAENFPNLIKRQFKIQDQIKRSRTITNLLGRSITYYDRLNDDLFKKAYQWGYRSLKADILNHLMAGFKNDNVVVRNNELVLIQVLEDSPHKYDYIMDLDGKWHPEIKTIYGELVFPVRFKIGKSWGGVKDV